MTSSSKLTTENFTDINHKECIAIINEINEMLNENIPIDNSFSVNRASVLNFLNDNDFCQVMNIDPNTDVLDFFDVFSFITDIKEKRDKELDDKLFNDLHFKKIFNESNAIEYILTKPLLEKQLAKEKDDRERLRQSYENNYKNMLDNEQFFPEDDSFAHDIEPEFDEQKEYEIRKHINNANTELRKALELINNKQHPILQNKHKLIIPDAPLIKNKQNYYTPENQELYEYLDEKSGQFKSKDNDFLMVNIPHDYDRAIEALKFYDKYSDSEVKERIYIDEPIITYYFNHLGSIDDIYDKLNEVFKTEKKPFKIYLQLTGVFETQEYDNIEHTYNYEAREIKWRNYKSSIPTIIKSFEDLDIYKYYIESVLHEYETTVSNTKLIIVNSISFTISRMRKVTGCVKDLPQEFVKSKSIIADNVDDQLCWYRFLAICLNSELLKSNITRRTQVAKQLLLSKFGINYSNNMTTKDKEKANDILNCFKGVDIDQIQEEAKEYKLNIYLYEYDINSKSFNLFEQWKNNDSDIFHSALLWTNETTLHIMYIKPDYVEKLTNILICPICKYYCFDKTHSSRLKSHMKICDGKFKKQFIQTKEALPYIPHILNNPLYEYCLAHNLHWKPNIYYMTYDFETMEQVVDKKISESTTINSKLLPISVSTCIKCAKGLTTKHFSIKDSSEFIAQWIEFLFERSVQVYEDKVKYLQSFINKNEDELNKIDKNLSTITIFGFNSSRFDSNLFKKYFVHSHWTVTNIIGTSSSLKQFILVSKEYKTKLRFIDAQSFVAGGTLKQFGIDFGGISNSIKGIFPYEAINTSNYNEVLSKSEPFEYNDFYSYLNQKYLLNKDEYEIYKQDAKNYATRLDYLLKYNDNDVEMMIKPIDNLIQMNAEYNVDLISNLSLSKNSVCIKYALAYKDFDINQDYDVINKVTTFIPNEQWFERKCENYYHQDEKYNEKINLKIKNETNDKKISYLKSKLRNLYKCICANDYKMFIEKYKNEDKCYLCGEHFTFDNKPTLDRIDNNIGHELSNCKLACVECNRLRKRKDDMITRLRIQLKKYCKLHHLPTLINDEFEYYSLRENITGGLSNVLHRMNIKGETKINRFRYVADTKKIVSYSTHNIQTHVVGIDFNSLYPSAFSSTYHEFNKYHGGVMYMPGGFIRRYNVFDQNGIKNKKIEKICIDIITSRTRFKPNPNFLFKAEVKLRCPVPKRNYFINFPPVFRNKIIKNDEDTLGTYMYSYMKKNQINCINKEERKLTQLLDSCDEYMTFSNYYLWFLIDHGLVIESVKNVSLYEAHTGFNEFVTSFMKKRQDIISGKCSGNSEQSSVANEKFYKISMNGSYGYDGMNTEHFSKMKICNKEQTYKIINSSSYINGVKLNDNSWLIQQNPNSFHCNTCLQESFWTLDNAKFWYLTFYYDFLDKCLDMNRLHVTSLDTDSIYFAVAGDENEGSNQEFKYIIKDKTFYDKHIYKFMPNIKINDIADKKKILGCCVEKYGENQIALCPKCYTIWNDLLPDANEYQQNNYDNEQSDTELITLKIKGISLQKNNLTKEDYKDVIDNNTIKYGKNINLQMKHMIDENNNIVPQMIKQTTKKIAVNATHNKMVVLPNQSCVPFIHGLSSKDYVCK